MFGMPDKAKVAKAFQSFKDGVARVREQSNAVTSPNSDTLLKLINQRVAILEKFVEDLGESL